MPRRKRLFQVGYALRSASGPNKEHSPDDGKSPFFISNSYGEAQPHLTSGRRSRSARLGHAVFVDHVEARAADTAQRVARTPGDCRRHSLSSIRRRRRIR